VDKGIGFVRTVTLDWLDLTAFLCLQQVDPEEMKVALEKAISETVHGVEARRKTLNVLSAIWIKTEKTAPRLREEALSILPTLSSPTERLWIHYGMTLVSYPIFRLLTAAIGQTGHIQETITRKLAKEKMIAVYGDLGGLNRSVERMMASLTDWGTLVKTKELSVYKIVYKQFSAAKPIQSWLLACALFAHPAEALAFNDLVWLPELYPFIFTVGIDDLLSDPHFEVQRQGGGLYMVRLQKAFVDKSSRKEQNQNRK